MCHYSVGWTGTAVVISRNVVEIAKRARCADTESNNSDQTGTYECMTVHWFQWKIDPFGSLSQIISAHTTLDLRLTVAVASASKLTSVAIGRVGALRHAGRAKRQGLANRT